MTKNIIIEQLAKDKVVEEIISNIGKGTYPDTDELAQDIYLELLMKDEDKIIKLHTNKQLKYFITTIVNNNLKSLNSRYYYNYYRWHKNRNEGTVTDSSNNDIIEDGYD